ncbi:glucose-methanol-choline oxidoreductase [Planoprotostelium fungivorum]|uniref:Glucose-methanol-choline oxidoreductase n=1 Tax=Planoprotostelium fungivorum TaxID=1890364 RepID=A0A2P6N2X9_9EUKA|nr:glucose-methanol-choline oxidoreductase [Planoprotostelium fungivorum]
MRHAFVLLALVAVTSAIFKQYDVFDYVVIGGGGAGSLFAARLSENPQRSVLVLEQGPNATCYKCDNTANMNDINDLYTSHGASQFTTPQAPAQRSFDQVKMAWPGGNTRIYQGISYPAHPNVYNQYPAGLSYETMLPYYRKYQDHYCNYLNQSVTGISPANCTKYHGSRGGPMGISQPWKSFSDSAFFKDMVADASELGVTYLADAWNGDDQKATPNHIFYQQLFRHSDNPSDVNTPRVRESTYSGYTPQRVLSRRNLSYKTEAQVIRIIFRDEVDRGDFFGVNVFAFPFTLQPAKQAVGVLYQKGDEIYAVFAKRQLVLAAGCLGSPKLLQISGVGPADLLASLGVPLRADNPFIGQNLAEQPLFSGVFKTKLPLSFTLQNFGLIGTMQLTSPLARHNYPDIQIQLLPTFPVQNTEAVAGLSPLQLVYPPQPYPQDPNALGAAPILNFIIIRTDPAARGSVNITGTSYRYNQQLDLGFSTDFGTYAGSEDYQAMAWALNYLRSKLDNSTAFGRKWIQTELVPGPAPAGGSQAYTDLLANAYGVDLSYHQTGGVNLGKATDQFGSVKGVSGITVCDNSVQPHPPNLNPTGAMLALCEYVADKLIQRT